MTNRIAPVKATNIGRLKVSLYGRPKVGKTRLACTFPKPLLIIGAEDGTASVAGIDGIDFVLLENCAEFVELIRGPVRERRYATVVVDNATRLRDMRVAEILGLDRTPVQKSFGYASREHWIQCAQNMKEMLAELLNLPLLFPLAVPLNIVVIAQEQNFAEEAGGGGDLITPNVGSALGKSVCDFLNAECDYVCQAFIREQTVRREKEMAGKTIQVVEKTGKKEFCLRVGPHEIYYTGFRVAGGAVPPDVIVDPTYEKIVHAIEGRGEDAPRPGPPRPSARPSPGKVR